MMILTISSAMASVNQIEFNWTFDGGYNESLYKWDLAGSNGNFSDEAFHTTANPNLYAIYSKNISVMPENFTVYADLMIDDNSNGFGRNGFFGFSNLTTGSLSLLNFGVQFNAQGNSVNIYENNLLLKGNSFTFNKGVTAPSPPPRYAIEIKLTNGDFWEVTVDGTYVVNATSNYTVTSAGIDTLVLHSYSNNPSANGYRNWWDEVALETECIENWQPYYSLCTIGDNQTLLYNDTNACGTFNHVPVDNGTISSCNYCSPTWNVTYGECVAGSQTADYDYTNTCCSDTGLASDCTIPANTTQSCIGIHNVNDISGLVIDFGVEFGIQMIALVGLVVVIGLGTWVITKLI